ncbi:pimeloyl-ACP methyl ester carboxylesterase [Nakamurella sp. UYEF19]|uniref:alpha/beta fold hydrolase n=1 Tax=Nakamurella sp. UYEF19 TaxID=1756392 RepID=UPI0033920023
MSDRTIGTAVAQEFSYLTGEAAELGLAGGVPLVERLAGQALAETGLSALRWGTDPIEAVWLHGGGLNAHTWDGTIMAAGLPSLAVDLPGHGDSRWCDDLDYSPVANAGPIVDLMRSTSATASIVVGQSLGGLTGIAIAAQRPDLVRALVVVDVSPGLVVEAAGQVRDFLAGPESFGSRDEIVDRALQFGFGTSREGLQRGVFLNTRVRPDGRVVFKHHLANLKEGEVPFLSDFRTLWPAAESLRIPVLLVRGERGFLTDEWEAEFLTRVPDSTAVHLDAGHNVQEDRPLELAAAITEFVGRVAPVD